MSARIMSVHVITPIITSGFRDESWLDAACPAGCELTRAFLERGPASVESAVDEVLRRRASSMRPCKRRRMARTRSSSTACSTLVSTRRARRRLSRHRLRRGVVPMRGGERAIQRRDGPRSAGAGVPYARDGAGAWRKARPRPRHRGSGAGAGDRSRTLDRGDDPRGPRRRRRKTAPRPSSSAAPACWASARRWRRRSAGAPS